MKVWLENNKIYFETVAPILMSIAAVLVSVSSYMLTQKQVELSSLAAEPHFYVKETYLYDKQLKKAYETELRIFNSGAEISNFSQNIHTLLKVEYFSELGRWNEYIPLYGYYISTFNSSDPIGQLSLIKGELNNNTYSNVYWVTQSSEFREQYGTVFLSLEHAINISYSNKLNEHNNRYFIDEMPASEEDFNLFINNFKHASAVDLSDLTAKMIGELVHIKRSLHE